MGRRGVLYSAAHDLSRNPSAKTKRAKKTRPSENMDPPSRLSSSKVSYTPQLTPTDAQREQMRINQLRGQEEEKDVRRRYETVDGINLSEPHVLPPRLDLRKTRTLHDPDLEEFDLDSRTAAEDEELGRIAELSVRDAAIIQLDNQLTSVFRQMRTLKTTADALLARAQQEGNPQALHHSEQIQWIVNEALIPWLKEVDENLDGVIEVTPEGEAVGESPEETGTLE